MAHKVPFHISDGEGEHGKQFSSGGGECGEQFGSAKAVKPCWDSLWIIAISDVLQGCYRHNSHAIDHLLLERLH